MKCMSHQHRVMAGDERIQEHAEQRLRGSDERDVCVQVRQHHSPWQRAAVARLASSSLRQPDAMMANVSEGAKRVRKDEMEVPDQKRCSDVEVSVDSTETHAMMEGLSVALDLPLESFSADLHIIRACRRRADEVRRAGHNI